MTVFCFEIFAVTKLFNMHHPVYPQQNLNFLQPTHNYNTQNQMYPTIEFNPSQSLSSLQIKFETCMNFISIIRLIYCPCITMSAARKMTLIVDFFYFITRNAKSM